MTYAASRMIRARRGSIIKRMVNAFVAIEPKVAGQRIFCLPRRLVVLQVNLFVLDRTPEPFDEHVVHRPATTVHADRDARSLQLAREGGCRKLAPLIVVENLGPAG